MSDQDLQIFYWDQFGHTLKNVSRTVILYDLAFAIIEHFDQNIQCFF